jgi:hypothetical protein
MRKIKVTDLEQFVLEQIYRPYQLSLGIGDERLERLNKEYNLETARGLLIKKKEWARLVLSRASRCGFYFPDYIQHPLVKFLKNAFTINWEPLPTCK